MSAWMTQWCSDRWSCKAESAQQQWFEPDTLSVVSGLTTLRLANLLIKHPVAYTWAWYWLESILEIKLRNVVTHLHIDVPSVPPPYSVVGNAVVSTTVFFGHTRDLKGVTSEIFEMEERWVKVIWIKCVFLWREVALWNRIMRWSFSYQFHFHWYVCVCVQKYWGDLSMVNYYKTFQYCLYTG